jgi:zinc carboxypeptidase
MRLTLALLLLPQLLSAQAFDFYGRGPYRPQVPRPEAVLGYPIGSRQTMYHQQQRVLERMMDAAPDRVRTEVIGRTWEGKEMRLLIISAPENLGRLDEIRADLAALADPRTTPASQARTLAQRSPVTVLLTHSVHGNEPAGFEAAMQTVYQLLASEEPATVEMLQHTVVLINPSQNPDGHERFAAWSNSVAVASDDPAALEQNEPWSVRGRYNHYRFDMNRDMLAQSQPESRALAAVYVRWHPQVVCDLHSTTSTYFFPPVSPATNQNLPGKTYQWFERFGRNNGAAFDALSWQYLVRDLFDLFYPGYIDMWPSLRGGVGMTYETDGGPALHRRKDDGTFITLADAIAHHYVASLATLEYAAANRIERLNDFYDFHASAMTEPARRPLRRVVFGPMADPARASWLAERLAREQIEVTRVTQPFSALRATSYLGGGATRRTFPAGSYVVDLAQPEGRLATAILEPRASFDSAFIRKELARYDRNQLRGSEEESEEYDFYDITAWSLPLTLGLDAWWTDETGPVTGDRVPADAVAPAVAAPATARSSYLFTNSSDASVRLASRLLREGFKVGAATEPLVADGVSYPAGTFVVRVQRNPATLHDRLAALAVETGAEVSPVGSAFPDTGLVGTGSGLVTNLKPPHVLLAAGDGIDQTAFGAIWFYLDRDVGIPVTPINLSSVATARLEDYNALIIASGSADRMWGQLGDDGAEKLKAWVKSGAAVIGIGGAVELLGRKELGLTTVSAVGDSAVGKDTVLAESSRPGPVVVSPSAPGGHKPEFIPGAIFRATMDRTHWLTFGYDRDQLPVFLETSTLFKPSKHGANPVAFTGSDLTLSGFSWPDNTERFLKTSVWAAVESVESGRVVLFADNPVYRGFWRGPARLLTNAVLMGPQR